LEFLRSRIEKLEEIIASIDRNALRSLSSRAVWVRPHQARTVSGRELYRSMRSTQLLRLNNDELAPRLRGFIPAKFLKDVKVRSLDTIENRDIKSALKRWAEWLQGTAGKFGAESRKPKIDVSRKRILKKWESRCTALADRLSKLLLLPMFEGVHESTLPMKLTEVYKREARYRNFFQIAKDFELGITNIFGDFLDVPLAKTFELYELWCFLRILRASRSLFKLNDFDPTDLFRGAFNGAGMTLARGAVTIKLGEGRVLSFQRHYREFWIEPDRRGSFTRRLKPDLSLELATRDSRARTLIILDAKYRIDNNLDDAISSLHTYRDALLQDQGVESPLERIVTGAYLLTPHFNTETRPWMEIESRNRLFHPEYRRAFRFGASTLMPGMSLKDIETALSQILADVGLEPETTG
jgi:hypothetical protein